MSRLPLRDPVLAGKMEEYFDRLWPIFRSLAGPGFRESLDILSELVPFEKLYYPTGQKVFDWTVPREWEVKKAYFIDPNGVKHCDIETNNLHLVGYSVPFKGKISLNKLQEHLHSIPAMPIAIPYITSYYEERWGFCISDKERKELPEGEYRVVIDTELISGNVVVGEAYLPGESEDELLFSSYLCHPSMANNELSGPLVLAFLFDRIAARKDRKYSVRFVLGPETIGSICYLSTRGEHFRNRLKAGYVLTVIGDRGQFTYKESRHGNTLADRSARQILREHGDHKILTYFPNGSDERQYCSPGFNLPVGSLMRTTYAHAPEYHTSLDNKEYISFEHLSEAVDLCEDLYNAIESNRTIHGVIKECEPFLSKYGVYPTQHSVKNLSDWTMAILWLQSFSEGSHDLLDIAERSGISMSDLNEATNALENVKLLQKMPEYVNMEESIR